METQPNWLVRHINLKYRHGGAKRGIAILMMALVVPEQQNQQQPRIEGGMNLLISSLVIFCARCSTPPLAGGAAVRFFAMNSISGRCPGWRKNQ
jgi:hypothetical protein